MADEGVEQRGQSELERCELTHRSNSSDLSLIEVISSPSGKGNSGVVSILCHLLQHILQEHSRPTNIFQWFTKNQDEPIFYTATNTNGSNCRGNCRSHSFMTRWQLSRKR